MLSNEFQNSLSGLVSATAECLLVDKSITDKIYELGISYKRQLHKEPLEQTTVGKHWVIGFNLKKTMCWL